jgi:hypothetical protein
MRGAENKGSNGRVNSRLDGEALGFPGFRLCCTQYSVRSCILKSTKNLISDVNLHSCPCLPFPMQIAIVILKGARLPIWSGNLLVLVLTQI